MWAPETGHQDKSLPRRFSSSPNHVFPALTAGEASFGLKIDEIRTGQRAGVVLRHRHPQVVPTSSKDDGLMTALDTSTPCTDPRSHGYEDHRFVS
jgi:hypothetical protein